MYHSKETIDGALKDYRAGILTVAQISAKYNIPRRTIYSHLKKKDMSTRSLSFARNASTIRLTRGEIEGILLLISDYGCELPEEYKKYIPPLEERLLEAADKTNW